LSHKFIKELLGSVITTYPQTISPLVFPGMIIPFNLQYYNHVNGTATVLGNEGASHNHTISSDGTHTHNINNTCGGNPHNNMPPFYVLIYIMKL
jgi:hypothetical protein